jgi:hypothetical protein
MKPGCFFFQFRQSRWFRRAPEPLYSAKMRCATEYSFAGATVEDEHCESREKKKEMKCEPTFASVEALGADQLLGGLHRAPPTTLGVLGKATALPLLDEEDLGVAHLLPPGGQETGHRHPPKLRDRKDVPDPEVLFEASRIARVKEQLRLAWLVAQHGDGL